MTRPSDEDLISDYMRDLESDIESSAREIKAGRSNLVEYVAKCRAELKSLREPGAVIRVDRYGMPSVVAKIGDYTRTESST
jgi:hypothetical protein